jgi:hypothetical protein
MSPISKDPQVIQKEMKKRMLAYINGRVSTHSADVIKLFPIKPRFYSSRESLRFGEIGYINSIELTEPEKKLYGLI